MVLSTSSFESSYFCPVKAKCIIPSSYKTPVRSNQYCPEKMIKFFYMLSWKNLSGYQKPSDFFVGISPTKQSYNNYLQ
jgi:hypothetical protein